MDSYIEELTARLFASFGKEAEEGVPKGVYSKKAVDNITKRLLRIIFPGYFEDESAHQEEIHVKRATIREQLSEVEKLLLPEIRKNLLLYSQVKNLDTESTQKTREFLSKLPEVREILNTDIQAAYEGDPAASNHEEIILAYPGVEAIAVHRLAHQLHLLGIKLLPRMMTEWAHSRTGIDIHPGATIGTHFFIDHGTGVVIGETTEIGNHVKIYHGVTLGARSTADVENLRGKKRHPTIGNHVTIYPGATILGGETIVGENSTIGGNVFLIYQNVPPNHVVVNEEHTVIMRPKKSISNILDFTI